MLKVLLVNSGPRQSKKKSAAGATRRPRKAASVSPEKRGPLIQIDGRPIRERARREYEKTLKDIDAARSDLARHQRQDQPLFARWTHETFGPVISEIQRLEAELRDGMELLTEIEMESITTGCDPAAAFERVSKRRAKAAENKAQEEFTFGGGERERAESQPEEEDDGEFSDLFEEMRGWLGSDESKAKKLGKPEAVLSRIKELYRALVRKLHPDAQGEMSDEKREWWHQVQSAYQAGNVEQLEVILSMCDTGEETGPREATVSMLHRLTQTLKRTLKKLRSELASCRRDPAWKFADRKETQSVKARLRRELNAELRTRKSQLAELEDVLSELKRSSRRRRSGRFGLW